MALLFYRDRGLLGVLRGLLWGAENGLLWGAGAGVGVVVEGVVVVMDGEGVGGSILFVLACGSSARCPVMWYGLLGLVVHPRGDGGGGGGGGGGGDTGVGVKRWRWRRGVARRGSRLTISARIERKWPRARAWPRQCRAPKFLRSLF